MAGEVKGTTGQFDSITDKAGTGSPDFTQGLEVSNGTVDLSNATSLVGFTGKYQQKQGPSVSTDQTEYLKFNNLTVGRTYLLAATMRLTIAVAGDSVDVQIIMKQNTTTPETLQAISTEVNVTSASYRSGVPFHRIFTATGAGNVYFEINNMTGNADIATQGTYATLYDITDVFEATTDWT